MLINQPTKGWSTDQQDIKIFCVYLQDSILLHSRLADQRGSVQLFWVISGIIFTQASSRESKGPRDQPRHQGKPKYLFTFSVISGIIFTQTTVQGSPRYLGTNLGTLENPRTFFTFSEISGLIFTRDSSSHLID